MQSLIENEGAMNANKSEGGDAQEWTQLSSELLLRVADTIAGQTESNFPSLSAGACLNSLVLQEASALSTRHDYMESAASHLRHAMDVFDRAPLSSSLYRGITGLGWAIQNFSCPELIGDTSELLEDLDSLLAEGIEVTNNPNVDIINGIAGIGIYGLSRGSDSESSSELWRQLFLCFKSVIDPWRIGDANAPDSVFNNLGVAHGIPGLLLVTAEAARRGHLPQQSTDWVNSAMDRLWESHRVYGSRLGFPARHSASQEARLAWCYGSLGLASLFLVGAMLKPENKDRFLHLVNAAIEQHDEAAHGFRDASVCHGYAGAALAFSHFSQSIFVDEALRIRLQERALRCGTVSVGLEQRSVGAGHFTFWTRDGFKPSTSLLEGSCGVAMANVAASTRQHKRWMDLLGYF